MDPISAELATEQGLSEAMQIDSGSPVNRKRARSVTSVDISGDCQASKRSRADYNAEEINTIKIESDAEENLVQDSSKLSAGKKNTLSMHASCRLSQSYKDAPRERLSTNGIKFVAWDAAPASIQSTVNTILDSPELSTLQLVSLETRAKRISSELFHNALKKQSEVGLTMAIIHSILPFRHEDSVLRRDFNEDIICKTVPKHGSPMVAPLSKPRPDTMVGYEINRHVIRQLKNISLDFDVRLLKSTNHITCAQLVVELKSSSRGGSTATAMAQTAGGAATLSNSLACLHDMVAATSRADNQELLLQLRDCLVFGLVINDFFAHITVTWRAAATTLSPLVRRPGAPKTKQAEGTSRSRGKGKEEKRASKARTGTKAAHVQEEFHFALVRGFPLHLPAETAKFLRQVDAIVGWMEGRFGTVMQALHTIQ